MVNKKGKVSAFLELTFWGCGAGEHIHAETIHT